MLDSIVIQTEIDFICACNAGVDCLKRELYIDAVTHLLCAIELKPDSSVAYHALGNAFKALGNLDIATSAYEKAAEYCPRTEQRQKLSDDFCALGKDYAIHGSLDKAMHSFEKALELIPRNSDAHNGLGYVYVKKGDGEKAAESFMVAVGSDKRNSKANINLGMFYSSKMMPSHPCVACTFN